MNILNTLSPVLMEDKGFSLSNLMKGLITWLQEMGGYVIVIAGIILIVVGVVQIVKGLAGGGKGGQTNWVLSIAAVIVGGALAFGGWTLVSRIASSGSDTLKGIESSGGDGQFRGDDGLKHGPAL